MTAVRAPARRHVTVADALASLPRSGERFAQVAAFGDGAFEIDAPAGVDRQAPHDRDEACVVGPGRGMFVDGPARHAIGPGDLLLVPAGVEHRFVDFEPGFATRDFFFFGPAGGAVGR